MADNINNINQADFSAYSSPRFHWSLRWALLFLFMLAALMVVGLSSLLGVFFASEVITFSITSLLQNFVAFVLPAVAVAAVAWLMERRRGSMTLKRYVASDLRINSFSAVWLLVVVVGYIIAVPVLNWLVDWNDHFNFGPLEQQLRQAEQMAADITSKLLDVNSFWQMMAMVIVIGVATGIGEEFFFRGGLLAPMLRSRLNRHLAVWIVAIVFSAMHFQFYGFVPRLVLGLWLGYLLLWSRSLWVPIIAHSINNSMVVVISYLSKLGFVSNEQIDAIGVAAKGQFPWLALGAAVIWLALAIIIDKKCKNFHNLTNNC